MFLIPERHGRTDRQTDRQTDRRLSVASPRSALASRGKKRVPRMWGLSLVGALFDLLIFLTIAYCRGNFLATLYIGAYILHDRAVNTGGFVFA